MTTHSVSSAQSAQQAQQTQQQQQAPTFRSSVTLVPVDVRVVDKNGKPITGLEQKDFTVLEDGVPQQIGHFSRLELASGPATPGATVPRRLSSFSVSEQKNRIFLLVLGRGRLQEPSKGVDSLIRFVREQLLPQDQLAVFAYDRATDFTTDHEEVARLLERFRRLHEGIDMEIGLQINSGMAAVYGARAIPKNLQSRIDEVFQPGGALASHAASSGQAAGSNVNKNVREATSAVQALDVEKTAQKLDAMAPAGGTPRVTMYSELEQIEASLFTDLPLDDFMSVTGQSLQDLGNIYAGIEYLRHLDGEKHLVYVSEKGMNLPTQDEDELLARTANDARVVLDTFQTGGIYTVQTGGQPVNSLSEAYAKKTMRALAEMTGGVSSVQESGKVAMDRLDEATRSGYVIGYYPATAVWTGKYRTITVKVNRPDTTVLFRRGYYARNEIGAFDRRGFITRDRLQAALMFRREINDIRVKMNASVTKGDTNAEVTVTGTIDPTRLSLKVVDGFHVTDIDIAIIVTDENGQQMMGQSYQRANVKLTEEMYQKARKDGIPYGVRFPAAVGGRRVRIVVYDFKADLVGSADARVL
jgi:VWFA-related protein